MANIKFSDFTANAAIEQADHFLVGFDDDDRNGGANPKNNKWTFAQVADGLIGVTAKPYSIYAADGTIATSRVATITDTPKFQGDESTNIGLEVNNQYNSSMNPASGGAKILLSSGTSGVTTLELRANRTGNGGSHSSQTQINSSSSLVFSATNTMGWMYQFNTGTTASLAYHGTTSGSTLRIGSNGGATPNRIDLGWDGADSGYIGVTGNTIGLGQNNGGTLTEHLTIGSSGNVGIGATIDTGVTLKVDASGPDDQMAIIAKGRDQAAGDYSLICQDSAATNLFIVENDGLVTVGKNLKISGQGYTEIESSVAIDSINWNNSNVQEVTLVSGATTDFDATNFKAGATYILKLIQPAGGNALVGWEAAGAVVNWSGGTPPTLSTAAAAEDIVTLICTSAAGNGTYYANATLNFS